MHVVSESNGPADLSERLICSPRYSDQKFDEVLRIQYWTGSLKYGRVEFDSCHFQVQNHPYNERPTPPLSGTKEIVMQAPQVNANSVNSDSRNRSKTPIDAIVIWCAICLVIGGLDWLTGTSSISGDIHASVLGAVVLYPVTYAMDRLAQRLGPPFATATAAAKGQNHR